MPLLLNKKIDEHSAYAVWNIQETFLEIPYLAPEPFPADLNPVRQAEWIVGRVLVKSLCDTFGIEYKGISKQDNGKPYLNDSHAHISISHSFPIAAAMIHLKKPCGIDMERPREKHKVVQHKFLHSSEEQYQDDLEKLCTIWGAKEVVYKIFGRRFLSLKDEIKTEFKSDNLIVGEVLKPGYEDTFEIHYEWVKEYLLAFGT
ncbi:MAG: 4'-phosphopantetheinyl transferase superfamily protein [Cyclobacteriaceae bacterium]